MSAEMTPAMERVQKILFGHSAETVREVLAAALDIEEMAQAIHESDQGPDVWDMESDYYQDVYRENARALRTALLGADS